jgi:hypothetical protein
MTLTSVLVTCASLSVNASRDELLKSVNLAEIVATQHVLP